jgi:hypothetical protein
MPAPTQSIIKANIVAALKVVVDPNGNLAYTKKTITQDANGNNVITIIGGLPQDLDNIVGAIAQGIADTWEGWQSTQTVTGVDTVTSALIKGILP